MISNLDSPNQVVNVGLLRKIFRINDRMCDRIVGSEAHEPTTLGMEDDRKDGDAVTAIMTLQKFVPNLEIGVKMKIGKAEKRLLKRLL